MLFGAARYRFIADSVIITLVSALPALEFMPLPVSVFLGTISTYRAVLACIGRSHGNHTGTGQECFVFQHLPEFIAAPADRHIALFGADLLCGFPYTGQILQHVKRSGSIVGDKCLGSCMVYRSYITGFSLPKLFKLPFSGFGSTGLKTFPKGQHVRPFLLDRTAGIERAFSRATGTCGNHFLFLQSSLAVPNRPSQESQCSMPLDSREPSSGQTVCLSETSRPAASNPGSKPDRIRAGKR